MGSVERTRGKFSHICCICTIGFSCVFALGCDAMCEIFNASTRIEEVREARDFAGSEIQSK